MSTLSSIGLKNPDWDLNKSRYEVINSYLLMDSPGPVLMILAVYLLFVLKLGPSFMQKRQAFQLKYPLLIYNIAQVVGSAYLVYLYISHIRKYGLLHSTCLLDKEPTRSEMITCIHIYFLAKVTELLDTVFFVVRKKDSQVTFLHLYHHSVMMTGTWAYLKYAPSDNVVFIGFMNSLVHVFMYSYYGLSALGPRVAPLLFWKKYMTSFQLFQFFSVLVHYFSSLFISECPPSRAVYLFFIMNIITFIALFTNFYNNSYRKHKTPKMSPAAAVALTSCCQPKLVSGDAICREQSKLKHC